MGGRALSTSSTTLASNPSTPTVHPDPGNQEAEIHTGSEPESAVPERRSRMRAPSLLTALLVCLVLSRFWGLGSQAFHHDESIHAKASWDLSRRGPSAYRYNPVYHGPFFYHAGAGFSAFLPDTDFTARLPYAIAGCLLVSACLLLLPLAGWRTTGLAAALLIVSPTVTYYSRFARGDVWMTAFLAVIVAGGALYLRTARLRWLSLAWLAVVLGYVTKENSYVNHALVCGFVVALAAWRLATNPKRGLHDLFVRYLPLTRLLVIFGFVSVFTFLYVGIDCRVGPGTDALTGLARIARHSVSITSESTGSPSDRKLPGENGYFSAPGREGAKSRHLFMAFLVPVIVLGAVEGISARIRRRSMRAVAACVLLAWVGYGATAAWLFDFAAWAGRYSGDAFLDSLRRKLLWGGLLLGGVALLSVIPAILSPKVRQRTGCESNRWRVLIRLLRPTLIELWTLMFQILLAIAVFCIFFSSLGTNVPTGLRAGLYDYIAYWFRQQTGEFRIWGPWWYYLPRLFLYEFAAVVLVGVAGLALWLSRAKRATREAAPSSSPPTLLIVFAACLTLGTIFIYALLNEKVYWLGIYQAFALNLFAAFLFARWLASRPGFAARIVAAIIVVPALLFGLWQHALAVHLFPDSPTEPIAYVTTSRDYKVECRRILGAHQAAIHKGQPPPLISLAGEGVWPAAWYLRRTNTTAAPFDPAADIVVVDDSSMNRRRLSVLSGSLWQVRSVPVRGWWFSYGEGLPAGTRLAGNIAAFFLNANNDQSDAFQSNPETVSTRHPVGFAGQVLRFALFREPWYPATGTRVLFAWRTGDAAESRASAAWLKGIEQNPKESRVVARIGGRESAESLRAPRGLARMPNGDLAVADSGNGRIQIFHPDGTWVRSVGEGILCPDVTGPCGVAASPEGFLYVADTWNHAIRLFSPEGNLVATCGSDPSRGPLCDWYGPRGIAVAGEDENLRVYVTDTGNKRVVVLDRELRPMVTWGEPGEGPGQFNEPVGICVDAEGSVYVADTGNGRIQRFSSDGTYIEEYFVYLPSPNETVAIEPNLTVLPDGRRLAMTWSTMGTFAILDPQDRRAWPWTLEGGPAEPVGIVVTSNWSIFVTDRRSSLILELSEQSPNHKAPPVESGVFSP